MMRVLVAASLAASVAGQPSIFDKAGYARWMVGNMTWGIMSTTSTMSEIAGTAFGNPVSYADEGSGTPVFCVSPLDQSIIDLQTDSRMSLSMSRAAVGGDEACEASLGGDPENPPCSRVVLSGTFANVTDDEWHTAAAALNKTHPAMDSWGCFGSSEGPSGHDFYLAKLQVNQVWLIDIYGGASILTAADYFNATASAATAEI
mmetsp:Transcript_13297/g.42037  ORF Transcript_13297/g.42037 Transcript_13297/m.42037 type:complete len:203 (+) Transcript_13297:87-695(+)